MLYFYSINFDNNSNNDLSGFFILPNYRILTNLKCNNTTDNLIQLKSTLNCLFKAIVLAHIPHSQLQNVHGINVKF